jgi:hypothetical protein
MKNNNTRQIKIYTFRRNAPTIGAYHESTVFLTAYDEDEAIHKVLASYGSDDMSTFVLMTVKDYHGPFRESTPPASNDEKSLLLDVELDKLTRDYNDTSRNPVYIGHESPIEDQVWLQPDKSDEKLALLVRIFVGPEDELHVVIIGLMRPEHKLYPSHEHNTVPLSPDLISFLNNVKSNDPDELLRLRLPRYPSFPLPGIPKN